MKAVCLVVNGDFRLMEGDGLVDTCDFELLLKRNASLVHLACVWSVLPFSILLHSYSHCDLYITVLRCSGLHP